MTTIARPHSHRTVPLRGQVWFVTGDVKHARGTELWSNRDAVVVSPDDRNVSGGFVVVAYLRKQVMGSPMHVITGFGTVMTEQLHTVDQSRLKSFSGRLTDDELRRVENAIAVTIGIDLEED